MFKCASLKLITFFVVFLTVGGAPGVAVAIPEVPSSQSFAQASEDLDSDDLSVAGVPMERAQAQKARIVSFEPQGCTSRMCPGGNEGSIAGYALSAHAAQRMAQRGISRSSVEKSLTSGTRYYDSKNKSYVYIRSRVSVATVGKTITTVYRGGPTSNMSLF